MRTPGRPRTLRVRLVATVLVLLAAAFAVIGVATALGLREFLFARLDREVVESGARFVLAQTGRFPAPPPGVVPERDLFLGPVQGPRTLGATVRGGVVQRAEVSTRGGGTSTLSADDAGVLAAVAPGTAPTSVDLSLGPYRVLARQVADTTYVIGQPADEAQDVVNGLVVIEVVVIGLALVGAGVAGAVLVRRELRPLERVAETAASVGALPLDRGEVALVERVPGVDPHTEVGQVAIALNRMLDNVGGALEARQDSEMRLRQFVADASHELRTPLAAIRGHAELARHRTDAQPAQTEHALLRISSQADRMTALVEDLLLLARLDAGRPLERGEVDLTRLVVDAVADAHAAGPDHRWQLSVPDEPVVVPGDGSRLAQVLANLLANARTHTPPGTNVTVALTAEPTRALLSVTDDGPGLPPEVSAHLFEPFSRGPDVTPGDSFGLGLAIVQSLVKRAGGEIWYEDATPHGARFVLHLRSS
jgi:two-component system OmpR family sensor kinase